MNDGGTYSQSFTIVIGGLSGLPNKEILVPEKNITITLSPSDVATGNVTVQIRNTSKDEGRGLARRIIEDLFDELLLSLANHITEVVAPKPGSATFVDALDNETRLIEIPSGVMSFGSTPGHTPFTPSEGEINTVANRVRFHLIAPQPATSAQLYSAKRMFSIGMQTDDEVVRFLILYSAVALAALFKWHSGKHENVDRLLQDATPSLGTAPTGRNGKRETVYRKIRNDFIHAEERSVDPSGPMQEIHQRLREFQRDVAAVLNML